ncbi:MAG: sulfate ABC transporter permease subunit [Thiobacillaceae bacterium]|jgi:sulfate transport system permease protein|nr:sulfate ABC transporter permease subunit [Thiobacillaceae bacterium]
MTRIGVALAPERGGRVVRLAVLAYIGALVLLPLAALAQHGLAGGLGALWRTLASPGALHALWLTFWSAGVMALINALMGTATAWALVRYAFPGRAALSALVDLPFAIPTLVTGVMLVLLYGPQGRVGGWLAGQGWPVAFAAPGILLALLFVTLPFVVRAVEPVLLEQDPAEEEAARTLGAGDLAIFLRVLLPPLLPAVLSGGVRSFARALGEFGSIVVVSGNIPYRTLTAPVYIFGEIEAGSPEAAAAVSLVLLLLAVALTWAARLLERLSGVRGV